MLRALLLQQDTGTVSVNKTQGPVLLSRLILLLASYSYPTILSPLLMPIRPAVVMNDRGLCSVTIRSLS